MKRSRGVLLIFVISVCFFLWMTSNAFALFRDDVSIKEAEEWVSSEREKSRIELKKKQGETKEETLTFEQQQEEKAITPEKEVPSSVSSAKRVPFGLIRKIVASVVCLVLVIAIVFGSKRLFGNKAHND